MQLELNINKELTNYQISVKNQLGSWYELIGEVFDSENTKNTFKKLKIERSKNIVYPKGSDIFRAFRETPVNKCKVIIIGQDPYFNSNADGLAFSCKNKVSPSLKRILDVLDKSYENNKPYTLDSWAQQGVLLLNSSLTVKKDKPNSHKKYWKPITKEIIKRISTKEFIWLLWGNEAKSYKKYIQSGIIYEDIHPVSDAYNDTELFEGGFDYVNKLLDKPVKW